MKRWNEEREKTQFGSKSERGDVFVWGFGGIQRDKCVAILCIEH